VNNPALTRAEFIETLAQRFELGPQASQSKAVLLVALEEVLKERRRQGEITALVVDEAQTLSLELLEEIRLLANIETPSEKLLPLILAGQPELSQRLNEPALRQLKQRIALRCELKPFELKETAIYIASRIRTAGGEASHLFTREAVMLIHEHSRGIPRIISVICDNALVSGMALGKQPVGRDIVLEVCRDFDLVAANGSVFVRGQPSGDIDQESDAMKRDAPSEDRAQSDELRAEFSERGPRPLGFGRR
jgi:general secretion pathway protein A